MLTGLSNIIWYCELLALLPAKELPTGAEVPRVIGILGLATCDDLRIGRSDHAPSQRVLAHRVCRSLSTTACSCFTHCHCRLRGVTSVGDIWRGKPENGRFFKCLLLTKPLLFQFLGGLNHILV